MYSEAQRNLLKQIALDAIQYGLQHHKPKPIDPGNYDSELREQRASFVTLKINNQLRGCIGRLQAERPLVEDVAENAYSAAFRDPRFSALNEKEFSQLDVHISVLEQPVNLDVDSEQALTDKLQPGIDGVILSAGHKRGTFLPSVWESLPKASEFVRQLKIKAGLPAQGWSNEYRVQTYRVEEF